LGRAHGTLNAVFGANRSQVFGLGLTLLAHFLENDPPFIMPSMSLSDLRKKIFEIYL
jgi:hypothetical protein